MHVCHLPGYRIHFRIPSPMMAHMSLLYLKGVPYSGILKTKAGTRNMGFRKIPCYSAAQCTIQISGVHKIIEARRQPRLKQAAHSSLSVILLFSDIFVPERYSATLSNHLRLRCLHSNPGRLSLIQDMPLFCSVLQILLTSTLSYLSEALLTPLTSQLDVPQIE